MQLVEPSVEACRRNPVRRDRKQLAGVQETNAGTVATARGPGGRNCVGSRPKLPRASGRRQVRGSERGDDGTHAPEGHRKTITFVAGLRQNGMTAPAVIDDPMNGPMFVGYVEQILAPTLERGEFVLMDNLPTHKVAGVREAIEAIGAHVLYLSAYSPDLNPIEMAFSKLKALLRKAVERTIPGLIRLIVRLLKKFSPEECRNFLNHAGYACEQT
jgi:transposase